jgi:peptidoglycan-associated lipoprotein
MLTSFARHAAPFAMAIATLPLLALLACGGDTPPAKAPEPAAVAKAPDSPVSRLPPQPPDSPTASAVRISQEITTACGIKDPDAYFAFDSAHVRPDDAHVLTQLISCFTSGPLKGRTMKLVGHADPRGSSDYNLTLGQSRADSVATYLTGKGMDKAKAESTTRGAMDATGNDEPSWARDRRVDIMLGQ